MDYEGNPENSSIRLNLTWPMILVTVGMVLVTVLGVVYVEEEMVHRTKAGVVGQFERFLDEKVRYEAAVLEEYITFIKKNPNILDALAKREKTPLYKEVRELYGELNQRVELTHMYFITPEGKVLLRAHDFGRDGDLIYRATFRKAKETGNLYYGLEFGLKKNYTLRVVSPWVVDGRLVGYLELGKEIDTIISEYARLLDTEVYLAVRKSVYRDAPDFVRENMRHRVATDAYYIVYSTFEVPSQIGAILDGTIDLVDISMRDKDYFVAKAPLTDVSGRDLGYFVFLNDVTLEHSVIGSSVFMFAMILGTASLLLGYAGYTMLRRREEAINALTSELNTQKEEVEYFAMRLQNIFDLQRNIVLLTDGMRLQMANRAMFDFFGFENLEGFLRYYECICERFIENSNYFHLGLLAEGENWVEALQHLPGEARIVAMLDRELNTHVFNVSINAFESDNYIISFTDISNTVLQQMKLKNRAIHDKLTGACNREFLEENGAQILREAEGLYLGVVIADIDHFKAVNDRYGHNRGDVVLQQFAATLRQTIRGGDYLIRWGGEEFVILIKVERKDALTKAVEHLRQRIEAVSFHEVGTVTASFGATFYRAGETFTEAVGRADLGLYDAKAGGRNQSCFV